MCSINLLTYLLNKTEIEDTEDRKVFRNCLCHVQAISCYLYSTYFSTGAPESTQQEGWEGTGTRFKIQADVGASVT